MARRNRKLDRVGTRAALETVRESPVITAVVLAPAVVLFVLAWALGGFGWAVLTLLVLAALAVVGFKYG
jgi:hypothetical protein